MKHYEKKVTANAPVENVFKYADDFTNFSSHMNKLLYWMLGGGRMQTQVDEGKGQKVGSHIKMSRNVFGINLFLDEIVTQHEPPHRKVWQTMGDINLIATDCYALGFEIKPENGKSRLKVYIDYDLSNILKTRLLGLLFGDAYAKWYVRQMIESVYSHSSSKNNTNLIQ